MPFKNSKQPVAAFLNIKRQQGLAAAKAFANKHSAEMAKAQGSRPYRARKKGKK